MARQYSGTGGPEANLYRKGKGQEAHLSHMGHVLAENRNNRIVTACVTEANGEAERQATLGKLDHRKSRHQRVPATWGPDKGYDDGEFFQKLEPRQLDPHFPLVKEPADPKAVTDQKRLPGIRARRRMKQRMKTEGYRLSQRCRKKIEECFGWLKVVGGWIGVEWWVGGSCVSCGKCRRRRSTWCGCDA